MGFGLIEVVRTQGSVTGPDPQSTMKAVWGERKFVENTEFIAVF